jgi:hypothetical protein
VGLQSGGASCDDLAGVPETPNVDYAADIQPLWGFACTGCHRANSANAGGLDLTPGASYGELVNVASIQVPGRDLVTPGRPEGSYLLEKINCANPQVGNRMRPGAPMDVADQALVRDWIAQGARMTAQPPDAGVPDLGPPDTGEPADQGPADAGAPDLGPRDQGEVSAPDAAPAPDAGRAAADASLPPGVVRARGEDAASGGCVSAERPRSGIGLSLALAVTAVGLRAGRRGRRGRCGRR